MSEKKVSEEVKLEQEMKYYDELVEIELFKDNNNYKDDVYVAVNGVGMIVPRGKKVKIPRKYAIALKQSQYQASASANYQRKLAEDAERAQK